LSKLHVLIVGYVWVAPNSSAAGSRMLQLINLFLKQDYNVTFACAANKPENAFNLTSIGVKETVIALNDSSFDVFIKELQPTIVMFDRFMIEEQFGWRVAENCPSALRVLDTEDLHFLRKFRQQQLKKKEAFNKQELLGFKDAKREIAAILRCDVTLIISTFEMNLLKEVFKIDDKILCYLPFLLDKIDTAHQNKWLPFKERAHFVFIGNFFHQPNVDAVLTLKKEIWPLIKTRLPEVEMHVYGAYATQQINELHHKKEGFLVKGFVEDAVEVVEKAKVVLAPLRFGAGIKGKLTEAMLCGTPSVTTSIGAEGMSGTLPWNGFVEDNFKQFSEHAIQLYSNEQTWHLSQENGVKIVDQIYDKEKIQPLFIHKINETIRNLKTHRLHNFMGSLLQHHTLQSTKYMSKWIEVKNS